MLPSRFVLHAKQFPSLFVDRKSRLVCLLVSFGSRAQYFAGNQSMVTIAGRHLSQVGYPGTALSLWLRSTLIFRSRNQSVTSKAFWNGACFIRLWQKLPDLRCRTN